MQLGPVAEDLHTLAETTIESVGWSALPARTTELTLCLFKFEGGERRLVRLRWARRAPGPALSKIGVHPGATAATAGRSSRTTSVDLQEEAARARRPDKCGLNGGSSRRQGRNSASPATTAS